MSAGRQSAAVTIVHLTQAVKGVISCFFAFSLHLDFVATYIHTSVAVTDVCTVCMFYV